MYFEGVLYHEEKLIPGRHRNCSNSFGANVRQAVCEQTGKGLQWGSLHDVGVMCIKLVNCGFWRLTAFAFGSRASFKQVSGEYDTCD